MTTYPSHLVWVLAAIGLFGVSQGSLAQGDPASGKAKAAVCAACHGPDGNSTNPVWPKIAGQHASYAVRQIKAVQSGKGRGPDAAVMTPMVASLSDQDIADLAAYYETQKPTSGSAPAEAVALGEKLFRGGDAEAGIPSCMSCHGPAGRGNGPAAYPAVAGQHAQYTARQLEAYRDGTRSTDTGAIMRTIAKRLSDEQIQAISGYLVGLQ